MTEYLTEQEQIEQLKKWLKQYGPTIIAGIVIAFLVTTGWRYWQDYRTKILSQASTIYDEMLIARAQNNLNGATNQASKLIKQYPNTAYAQLAAMMNARDAVNKKNYPEAITQLSWVIDHTNILSLKQIARLRIARILIAEKKASDALDFLKKVDDTSFNGLVDEVRGDAYLSLKDEKNARNAYELALKEIPNAEITRPILQMKYDNLGNS